MTNFVESLPKALPIPVFYSDSESYRKKTRSCYGTESLLLPRTPLKQCYRASGAVTLEMPKMIITRSVDESIMAAISTCVSDETSFFEQHFDIKRRLGRGSFGTVYKARYRVNGKQYAVKVAHYAFRSECDRRKRIAEVLKHEQVPRHANIIDLILAWEQSGVMYIQTELCCMSLAQYIAMKHDVAEAEVWSILTDLLSAVSHLHIHNFIHCDIKPDNVLFTGDGMCKLGDFSLLHTVDESATWDEVPEGDCRYLAPEVLKRGRYGPEADVFSVGVTILEVACDLDVPKEGATWQMLRREELPLDLMKDLSEAFIDVVSSMLRRKYDERSSASALLSMPCVHCVQRRRPNIRRIRLANTLCRETQVRGNNMQRLPRPFKTARSLSYLTCVPDDSQFVQR